MKNRNELLKNFDTKKVEDGREIGLISYDPSQDCFVGYILPTFGGSSVAIKWDLDGKSNLTKNSDLKKI